MMSTVVGGAGNDVLVDTQEATAFDGGGGRDQVDYSASTHAVIVDLAAGLAYKAPRILPFGDSITHGVVANREPEDSESGGYRRFLLETFADLNASADMVGSLANGPSTMADRDHEGHRGWTLNQLDAIDESVLTATRPDAVLLMAGTNDSSTDTSGTMVSDLRALLISLTNAGPDLTVFVATPPPVVVGQQSQTRANRVDSYNNAMPGLVAELAGQGRKVVFVDMRDLTTDDVTHYPADSGLHPTLGGYEKMAGYWAAALQANFGLRQGAIGLDQDLLVSIEDVAGGAFDDQLSGDVNANRLDGAAGNDRLDGRGGLDVLVGGAGEDTFVFRSGYGVLTIEDFTAAEDAIEVHGYGQWTSLQAAADGTRVVFSSGDSILLKGLSPAQVTADLFTWIDPQPQPPAGAIVGTAGDDILSGTAAADVIWGLAGADTIDGKAGADVMVGGAGDDIYTVDNIADQVVENPGEGVDEVHAYVNWTLSPHTEILYLRSAASLSGTGAEGDEALYGNSGANILKGMAGDDFLDGRGGDDRLDGGAGNDYLIGGAGADVFVYQGGGHDVIEDLASSEKVEVYGYSAWTSLQQVGSDVLITFSADDTLLLKGRNAATLAASTFVWKDPAPEAPPAGAVVGTQGADILNGTAEANVIWGLSGDDRIDGLGGADTVRGGAGADTFVFKSGYGPLTIEDLAAGDAIEAHGFGGWSALQSVAGGVLVVLSPSDSIFLKGLSPAQVTTDLFSWIDPPEPEPEPEPQPPAGAIVGTAGDDILGGTAAADVIWGLAGADTIDGKAGADVMVGGAGDDIYTVDNVADQVVENQGEGVDEVHAYVNWTLSPYTEILYLRSAANLSGTGGEGDEALYGNSGANILKGMAGDDFLDGRGGNDRLDGGAGNDYLIGGAGADVFVYQGGGHDVIEDLASSEKVEVYGYSAWTMIEQTGLDVLITFSADDTLRLVGRTVAQAEKALLFL